MVTKVKKEGRFDDLIKKQKLKIDRIMIDDTLTSNQAITMINECKSRIRFYEQSNEKMPL